MSGLDYETVARFAQQGGTLYFAVVFIAGVAWALWPGHRDAFRRLSQLPLEKDEGDHV
jgi:cytochrome c oxidase cbb3-type subunit 4